MQTRHVTEAIVIKNSRAGQEEMVITEVPTTTTEEVEAELAGRTAQVEEAPQVLRVKDKAEEEATEGIPRQTSMAVQVFTEVLEEPAMRPVTVLRVPMMLTEEEEVEEPIMVTEEGTAELPEAEVEPAQFAIATNVMELVDRYILLGSVLLKPYRVLCIQTKARLFTIVLLATKPSRQA